MKCVTICFTSWITRHGTWITLAKYNSGDIARELITVTFPLSDRYLHFGLYLFWVTAILSLFSALWIDGRIAKQSWYLTAKDPLCRSRRICKIRQLTHQSQEFFHFWMFWYFFNNSLSFISPSYCDFWFSFNLGKDALVKNSSSIRLTGCPPRTYWLSSSEYNYIQNFLPSFSMSFGFVMTYFSVLILVISLLQKFCFSRRRKYDVFFSPSSTHCVLDLRIIPLARSSSISSNCAFIW